MNLGLEANALRLSAAAAVSAGTAVNGAVIDTQNFDGAMAFATIATANAGNFIKWQMGAASDLSDAADVAGSKVIAVANGQVVASEISRPTMRYVRPVLIRAGANTATGDMYSMLVNGANQPVTNQVTNTLITNRLVSPPLGTA